MKTSALISSLSLVLSLSALADSSIVLNGVHNCCKKCDNGINEAITKVAGATAQIEKNKVTVTAKDEATAKQAVASLVSSGYFGEGAVAPAVADAKVKSATVDGVHLCCGKCVTAVENAVTSVGGVTGHTATKGATSFKVEGDFNTKELAAALNKNGFSGQIK
jgi:copper chaperone CopZ